MPVEITIRTGKDGRKMVVGYVKPGHYATVDDYSSGRHKNLSVHVFPGNHSAAVYEFGNGSYSTLAVPGFRYLPLQHYNKFNLNKVLRPGQYFEHPLTTRSQAKGKVAFRHLPSHRGARTSLMGRHH